MKLSHHHIEKRAAKLAHKVIEKCRPVGKISGDDIHDLRTTVKKLDALVQLMVFINGDQNRLKNLFEPFRKLFKTLGELRKMQLMLRSLSKVNTLNVGDKKRIKSILLHRKTKAVRAYQKLLKEGIRHQIKIASDKIREIIKDADFKNSGKYFPHMKKEIGEITGNKELQGDDVHHARMLLKEVFYNAQLLKVKEQIPALDVSLESADQLLEKLGDWHDMYSAQQEYSAMIVDRKMNWQDMPGMKKMQQSLIKREALVRRQMISQLRVITAKKPA